MALGQLFGFDGPDVALDPPGVPVVEADQRGIGAQVVHLTAHGVGNPTPEEAHDSGSSGAKVP